MKRTLSIFDSPAIDPSLVQHTSRRKIPALAAGEAPMDVQDEEGFQPKAF